MITRTNVCLTMLNILKDREEILYIRQSALDFFIVIQPYAIEGVEFDELAEILLVIMSEERLPADATITERRKFYQSTAALLTVIYEMLVSENELKEVTEDTCILSQDVV